MGKMMKIDGDKVIKELKSVEQSLNYWEELEAKHPKGNTFFRDEIVAAKSKINAFKFVLEGCVA